MFQKLIEEFSNPWVLFGFGAQFLFFLRFFVQWIASERRGKSYIPVVFWWFSLGGGSMLFVYACRRGDPVFIAGQGLGCLIYIRNLTLIYKRMRRVRARKRSTMEVLLSDGIANGREETTEPAGPVQASAPLTAPDGNLQGTPGTPATTRSTAHAAS